MNTRNPQNEEHLVQAIGAALDAGSLRSLGAGDAGGDPLVDMMQDYAAVARRGFELKPDQHSSTWNAISARTGASINDSPTVYYAHAADEPVEFEVKDEVAGRISPYDHPGSAGESGSTDQQQREANLRPQEIYTSRKEINRDSARKSPAQTVPISWISSYRGWAAAAVLLVAALFAIRLVVDIRPEAPVAMATSENVIWQASDGTIVTLRPNSALYRAGADGDVHRYRLEGEAYFDVSPNPERTFAVIAGSVNVEVLGTRFNVRGWGAGTEVFVESGRVRVSETVGGDSQRDPVALTGVSTGRDATHSDGNRPSGHGDNPGNHVPEVASGSVELTAGQMVRHLGSGQFRISDGVSKEAYLAWIRSEIVFEERSLSDIVSELEHHYNTEIRYDQTLAGETISGRILLTDLRQSLRDLSIVSGVRLESEP